MYWIQTHDIQHDLYSSKGDHLASCGYVDSLWYWCILSNVGDGDGVNNDLKMSQAEAEKAIEKLLQHPPTPEPVDTARIPYLIYKGQIICNRPFKISNYYSETRIIWRKMNRGREAKQVFDGEPERYPMKGWCDYLDWTNNYEGCYQLTEKLNRGEFVPPERKLRMASYSMIRHNANREVPIMMECIIDRFKLLAWLEGILSTHHAKDWMFGKCLKLPRFFHFCEMLEQTPEPKQTREIVNSCALQCALIPNPLWIEWKGKMVEVE